MSNQYGAIILAALAIAGCSNKESHTTSPVAAVATKETSPARDGSAHASASSATSSTPKTPSSKQFSLDPKNGDGSDTFVYKPDPKLLKQLGKEGK